MPLSTPQSRQPHNPQPGRSLAIVGGGPSGLSAMESFCIAVSKSTASDPQSITMIEPTLHLGSGPNFASDQSSVNWLNIPARVLDIPAREAVSLWGADIKRFPGYLEWARVDITQAVDFYPTRAELGAYLQARYRSIADPLLSAQRFALLRGHVVAVHVNTDGCMLEIDRSDPIRASDVLLTIGHQPTDEPESLLRWRTQTESEPGLVFYPEPYPTEGLIADSKILAAETVAVRGLGLAMIDVVKALTEGCGGDFRLIDAQRQTYTYASGSKQPRRILPFSLDGLPPAPKPLGKAIDDRFRPTDDAIEQFAHRCQRLATGSVEENATAALIDEMAAQLQQWSRTAHARPVHAFEEDMTEPAARWLKDDATQHPQIVPTDLGTLETLILFRDMATGQRPASLDYSLGQVWRHLQPTLYEHLSYADLPPDEIAALTAIDERMKRYAFGPPVGSVGRLIALAEAGVLSFRVVDDPDISLDHTGWKLDVDEAVARATVMINSVLDAPKILAMAAPLPASLLATGTCAPIHEDLGIRTTTDGLLIDAEGQTISCIAGLGRLAKGTLIGTDSILECFGSRSDAWASGLIARWQRG